MQAAGHSRQSIRQAGTASRPAAGPHVVLRYTFALGIGIDRRRSGLKLGLLLSVFGRALRRARHLRRPGRVRDDICCCLHGRTLGSDLANYRHHPRGTLRARSPLALSEREVLLHKHIHGRRGESLLREIEKTSCSSEKYWHATDQFPFTFRKRSQMYL